MGNQVIMAKSRKKDYTPKDCTFSIMEQVDEINRELSKRKEVYRRMIKDGKLTTKTANKQYGKLSNARRSLLLLLEIMVPDQKNINL